MEVRKIKKEDLDLFLKFSHQFYRSKACLHDIDEKNHLLAFNEIINGSPFIEGYFFDYNGESIGFSILLNSYSREAGGNVIWIDELFIKEEYRHLGLGKEFFNWLFNNKKAARYRLEYARENGSVASFYKKQGFDDLAYLQMVKE